MKMKSFLIPALALALAGCANEELETIGSLPCPPGRRYCSATIPL